MNLLDIANRALAEFEAKTNPAEQRHRHWWIYFPDRDPVEVIFAPGINHKTVMLVYKDAASVKPITDELDGTDQPVATRQAQTTGPMT